MQAWAGAGAGGLAGLGGLRVQLCVTLIHEAHQSFDFGNFYREADVFETLTLAVSALGITESVCYHGIGEPETFQPVGLQIKKLADKFC